MRPGKQNHLDGQANGNPDAEPHAWVHRPRECQAICQSGGASRMTGSCWNAAKKMVAQPTVPRGMQRSICSMLSHRQAALPSPEKYLEGLASRLDCPGLSFGRQACDACGLSRSCCTRVALSLTAHTLWSGPCLISRPAKARLGNLHCSSFLHGVPAQISQRRVNLSLQSFQMTGALLTRQQALNCAMLSRVPWLPSKAHYNDLAAAAVAAR